PGSGISGPAAASTPRRRGAARGVAVSHRPPAVREPPGLPPFPTRRSSDLGLRRLGKGFVFLFLVSVFSFLAGPVGTVEDLFQFRSAEHTSELQSRFELVCRLLLEKNKT